MAALTVITIRPTRARKGAAPHPGLLRGKEWRAENQPMRMRELRWAGPAGAGSGRRLRPPVLALLDDRGGCLPCACPVPAEFRHLAGSRRLASQTVNARLAFQNARQNPQFLFPERKLSRRTWLKTSS